VTYQEIGRLAEAVRGIPLTEILPRLDAVPDPLDKARWKTPGGVISVTGTRFYDWHRQKGGGGAIDLVMHIRKVDFKTAVRWLCDLFAMPIPSPEAVPVSHRPFQPPAPSERNLPLVIRYLEQERGLPETVLAPLVRERWIYADARANAVFLLRDHQGCPVGAELRGTSSAQWRGMAPGSRKAKGYFAAGPQNARRIILCESAIDAISAHALHPETRAISTAGATPHPAWLPELLALGIPIACAFDADEVGDRAAQAMSTRHSRITRLRPTLHDWNDLLRTRRPA
jgi:DNA primase